MPIGPSTVTETRLEVQGAKVRFKSTAYAVAVTAESHGHMITHGYYRARWQISPTQPAHPRQ